MIDIPGNGFSKCHVCSVIAKNPIPVLTAQNLIVITCSKACFILATSVTITIQAHKMKEQDNGKDEKVTEIYKKLCVQEKKNEQKK